jgi:hypothetical protein
MNLQVVGFDLWTKKLVRSPFRCSDNPFFPIRICDADVQPRSDASGNQRGLGRAQEEPDDRIPLTSRPEGSIECVGELLFARFAGEAVGCGN